MCGKTWASLIYCITKVNTKVLIFINVWNWNKKKNPLTVSIVKDRSSKFFNKLFITKLLKIQLLHKTYIGFETKKKYSHYSWCHCNLYTLRSETCCFLCEGHKRNLTITVDRTTVCTSSVVDISKGHGFLRLTKVWWVVLTVRLMLPSALSLCYALCYDNTCSITANSLW